MCFISTTDMIGFMGRKSRMMLMTENCNTKYLDKSFPAFLFRQPFYNASFYRGADTKVIAHPTYRNLSRLRVRGTSAGKITVQNQLVLGLKPQTLLPSRFAANQYRTSISAKSVRIRRQ